MSRSKLSVNEIVKARVLQARSLVVDLNVRNMRLIVAVSGGRDSVFLLDLLSRLSRELELELVVAHVNHGLRAESKEEEQFVARLADKYQLKSYLFQAPDYDTTRNMEDWARQVRYGFLQELLREIDADYILTAHHQNDEAETFLMKLINGRLRVSSSTISEICSERKLLRPILEISREQIDNYLAENQLDYCDDQSNNDLSRSRNILRHRLIPELEKNYNPRVIASLAEISMRLSEDEEYLWNEARRYANLTLQEIVSLPAAINWRAFILHLQRFAGSSARRLGRETIERASGWIKSAELRTGSYIELGQDVFIVVERGGQLRVSLGRP